MLTKTLGQPGEVGKVVGALAIESFSYLIANVFKVDRGLTIP